MDAEHAVLQVPSGLCRPWVDRPGADGQILVDALAGRTSLFGFGFAPLQQALHQAFIACTDDSAAWIDREPPTDGVSKASAASSGQVGSRLAELVAEVLGRDRSVPTDHLFVRPSADAAIDTAIGLARRHRSASSFRTIAFVGSDHGRTGMCRSASGLPALHDGYGPMMAGFRHVPFGDLKGLQAAIDEQTACVLLSPIDLGGGAVACQESFLLGVREICDQQDLLFVIDETQLVLGASGEPLTFQSIAEVQADLVIVSAGLFGGMSGGLILAGPKIPSVLVQDADSFSLQAAVAEQTLASMLQQELPRGWNGETPPLVLSLAEAASGFEFVRDIQATGLTIGIETDVESDEVVRCAFANGLRLGSAGAHSVRLQPPLLISQQDEQRLLTRLRQTLESLERESVALTM